MTEPNEPNEPYKDAIQNIFRQMNGQSEEDFERKRVIFSQLSPKTYEHPADKAALSSLRLIPGLDTVIRKLLGLFQERSLRLLHLANTVRCSTAQYPKIYKILQECCEILDIQEIPELYVAHHPVVNAGTIGFDHPFLVTNAYTVAVFSPDELRFLIGHELGHVLSGHALYKTLAVFLLKLGLRRFSLPSLALTGIIAAFLEWDRKSELTADRAGLLCLQDPEIAYRTMLKSAGGFDRNQLNLDAFMEQADEYDRGGDLRDNILKIMNTLGQTHPFWAVRLKELKKWVDDGDYQRILDGQYTTRNEPESFIKDVNDSAKSYQEEAFQSEVGRILGGLGELGSNIWDQVRDFFNGNSNSNSNGNGSSNSSGNNSKSSSEDDNKRNL